MSTGAINTKFGGDTSNFDAALRKVKRDSASTFGPGGAMTKNIEATKRSAGQLVDILKFGGAAAAVGIVFGAFRTLTDHAKDAAAAGDESAQAVVRFGEAMKATTNDAKDFGVWVLSWFNRVGEAVGTAITSMASAAKAGPPGEDLQRVRDLISGGSIPAAEAEVQKQIEEARARIAKNESSITGRGRQQRIKEANDPEFARIRALQILLKKYEIQQEESAKSFTEARRTEAEVAAEAARRVEEAMAWMSATAKERLAEVQAAQASLTEVMQAGGPDAMAAADEFLKLQRQVEGLQKEIASEAERESRAKADTLKSTLAIKNAEFDDAKKANEESEAAAQGAKDDAAKKAKSAAEEAARAKEQAERERQEFADAKASDRDSIMEGRNQAAQGGMMVNRAAARRLMGVTKPVDPRSRAVAAGEGLGGQTATTGKPNEGVENRLDTLNGILSGALEEEEE